MNNSPSIKAQINEYLQVLKTSWDMQLRRQARRSLVALAPDILSETLDKLVQSETDTELLAYVAEIIVESDRNEGALRILPLLQSPASHLRRHTCGLLSNCRDNRTIAPLTEILTSDPSADVRVIAAFALGKLQNPLALPALRNAVANDFATDFEETSVSNEAARAISLIQNKPAAR